MAVRWRLGRADSKGSFVFFVAFEHQAADTPREVEFPRLDGASRDTGVEAYYLYASLEGPFESTNDAWALTPRVDFYLPSSQTLTLRYNVSSATALNTSTTGDPRQSRTNRALSNDGTEQDEIHYGTAQLTSMLAPTKISELRFTVSREERPRLINSDTSLIQSTLGRFGARSFLPTMQHDTRIQVNDAVSLTSGSHSVKIGVDYNRLGAAQNFGFHQFGRFILYGSNPNQHLDCLSVGGEIANRFDCPGIYLRQVGNLRTEMDLGQFAFFAQDSWRVTSQFTVNFGTRWEAQFNPEVEATNADLLALVQGVRLPLGSTDPAVIPDSANQIMPRLGFAYRPFAVSNKTVVRGSFGIYYATAPLLLFADPINNFCATPGNLSLALPTTERTMYQQFLVAGINLNDFPLNDVPVMEIAEIKRVAGGGADGFAGAQPVTMADDYRNPHSIALTAGLNHEITHGLVEEYSKVTLWSRTDEFEQILLTARHLRALPNLLSKTMDEANSRLVVFIRNLDRQPVGVLEIDSIPLPRRLDTVLCELRNHHVRIIVLYREAKVVSTPAVRLLEQSKEVPTQAEKCVGRTPPNHIKAHELLIPLDGTPNIAYSER